jgi:dienelactone hydrolase
MKKVTATLAISVAAYCAAASGQAFLGAKELNTLIVGNTLHSQNLQRGYATKAFVDPSGKFLFEISGSIINGTWRIKADGAFCVTIAGESCSRVQKNADGSYTRIQDGVPRAKWLKVTPGNALSIASPPGEAVSFQSLTFSVGTSTAFMPPSGEGMPAGVSGFLAVPPGTDALPAVVLMHGCQGISGAEVGWATTLNRLGIATLVVDSFRGRGIAETCTGKEFLHAASALVDAYRALDLLAANPRIDPSRIAIMGFSLGGQHALWASQARFQERYGKGSARFAAYLAFYPAGCITRLEEEDRVGGGPIRIFHGAADDWTLIGPCKEYVERLRRAGRDAALIEYAGAHHSFDNPGIPLRTLPEVRGPRNCAFVEQDGKIIDPATGSNPMYSSCWSRGATIGYNADAHGRAVKDVETVLREPLGLK